MMTRTADQSQRLLAAIRHTRVYRPVLIALKLAQERLGHSTISTTLDLYSHVTETMQQDTAPVSTPHSGLL